MRLAECHLAVLFSHLQSEASVQRMMKPITVERHRVRLIPKTETIAYAARRMTKSLSTCWKYLTAAPAVCWMIFHASLCCFSVYKNALCFEFKVEMTFCGAICFCYHVKSLHTVKECSYHLSHLISSDLTSFIWTHCAVIGHSHGELGRALWSDPVSRGSDQTQRTQFRWNVFRWGEMRWVLWTLLLRVVLKRKCPKPRFIVVYV